MCLIHIWTKGEVGALLNRFKPSSKILYWLFQGGLLLRIFYVFFLSCICYAFVHVCLYVPCGHLLGKSWPLGSRLWFLTVSLLLSHWYPGSGVVLDCIDSWSLHPHLLWNILWINENIGLVRWYNKWLPFYYYSGRSFVLCHLSKLFLRYVL